MALSGPATGLASGGVPGQIGTCVCPGVGCQTFDCARRPPQANTVLRTKIKSLMILLKLKD